MRKLLIIFVLLLLVACASQQSLTTKNKQLTIPEHWRVEILNPDLSQFPKIKMQAVVTDSVGEPVRNLAPPFGYLEDWQHLWRPVCQRHPVCGECDLLNFTVTETQFVGVRQKDELERLKRERAQLEAQLERGRKIFADEIDRVNQRKRNLPEIERKKARNTSVVLVMDISGSMSGAPLEKAKLAAAEFLEFSDANIAAICFNTSVSQLTTFTRDKNKLVSSVMQLGSNGGTNLYDALYHALKMLKSVSGEKHILALTDGETSGDRYSLQQIINLANSGDVSVVAQTGEATKLFTIGLSYRGANLRQLANETGGKHYYTNNPDELLDIFSDYVGFQLEHTRSASDLAARLTSVNREIDRIQAEIVKDYHYDIAFEVGCPLEDGLDQEISFKIGDRLLHKIIRTPISLRHMQVRGKIRDAETGEDVPRAKIVINPQERDTSFTTEADSSGNFKIKIGKFRDKYSVFVHSDDHFIFSQEENLARPDSYYVTRTYSLPKAKVGAVATLRTIHFENNEFLFEPNSLPDLASMGRFLAAHPEFKLEIGGHTDSYGKASYNKWLSEKRAETVAEFFTGMGVPQKNISSKGYGESKLLKPDTSQENRYLNRRVEVRLVGLNPQAVSFK